MRLPSYYVDGSANIKQVKTNNVNNKHTSHA